MAVTLSMGYHERFRHRVIQDAIAEATTSYWLRRAATFEWARPRPTDWRGEATANDLADLDRRLSGVAEACRCRAFLTRLEVPR